MIKFFRKIRYDLMEKNKTGKYLKYAIGEIVLVVIGILIALQINNSNEERKERVVEYEYLKRVYIDLQKDIDYLNEKILFAERSSESFNSFIIEMHRVQRRKEDMIRLISSVNWDAQNLIIQDKTYSEIISSGKLSMISRKDIKESIDNYYRNCQLAQQRISEMNQTGIDLFLRVYTLTCKYYEMFSIIYDDEMYHQSNWQFINEPTSLEFRELEGSASYHYFKQTEFTKYYTELLIEGKKLSKQLREFEEE
jgi:hypothetical protein